jgi:hypothetical protein
VSEGKMEFLKEYYIWRVLVDKDLERREFVGIYFGNREAPYIN